MAVLDQLPETGRVVIAHPNARLVAGVWADRKGLDLFLTDLAGTNHVYVMDLDAIFKLPDWEASDGD